MNTQTAQPQVLREEDLRPVALQQGQQEAFARDIARLQKRKDSFVAVNCPACGSAQASPAFEKCMFFFDRCETCATVYMNPRPTPEIMRDYYSNSENYQYWAKYIFPISEKSRKEKLYTPWVQRIQKICRERALPLGTLTEIGAGFGGFAEVADRSGFFEKVMVIEPTPELAQACRERGLWVLEKRVEDISDEIPPVDILVSFEVIEHLFDPSEFFAQAFRLLKPGGLLVVSCPNAQGFDIEMLGPISVAVDAEHVNLLTPQALTLLLQKHGFDAIVVETPGRLDAELVREAVLSGQANVASPFLKRVLFDQWEKLGAPFQQFLAENGLSSHMWAHAQKSSRP